MGGKAAYLVIGDRALPKRGTLSVGVARHGCGQLGKRANCQSLVSLNPGAGRGSCAGGFAAAEPCVPRLPDEWVSDAARRT